MEKIIEYLRVKGMSEVTIKNYVCRIRYFLKGLNPEDIAQDRVNNFFLGISKNASFYNGYIHAVSAYLEFANREAIKLPKRLKEIHESKVINEQYFEREVISAVGQIYHRANDYFKVRALFYLFFYSDVRMADLESLRREDFDLKNNAVKIRASKGKPERVCFCSTQAKEAIDEYFYNYPEEANAFDITHYNLITKVYRLKHYFHDINLNISLLQRSGKLERRRNMK